MQNEANIKVPASFMSMLRRITISSGFTLYGRTRNTCHTVTTNACVTIAARMLRA